MKRILTLIMVIMTIYSCEEASQDPRLHFTSKKLPKKLEELANPKLTKNMEQRIIEASSKKTGIRINVIDQGIDYMHPGLVEHLDFKEKDGKITGIGSDIFGNDNWAHANKVDPSLYAFGAKAITAEGLIDGEIKDPLKLLIQINDDLVESIVGRINNHPVLSKSLYSKLHQGNFTLGDFLHRIQETKDDKLRGTGVFKFNKKEYKKNKRLRLLLGKKYEEDPEEKLIERTTHYKTIHQAWTMQANFGLNEGLTGYFFQVEGADIFSEIVEEEYARIDKKYNLTQSLETLLEYKRHREGSSYRTGSMVLEVKDAIIEGKYPGYARSPIVKALENIQEMQTIDDINFLSDPSIALSKRVKRSLSILRKGTSISLAYLDHQTENRFVSPGKKRHYQQVKSQLKDKMSVIENMIKENPELVDHFLGTKFDARELYQMDLFESVKNYSLKIRHPYFLETSHNESHSTHVSGSIMAQDDRLRIYPTRIITAGTQHTEIYKQKLKKGLISDLKKFLEQEITIHAIMAHDTFRLVVDPKSELDIEDQSDLKKARKKILNIFKTVLLDRASEIGLLDIEFFDQMKKAVRVAGKEKIKIANISLGTAFEKVTDQVNPKDIELAQKNFTKFMMYEFFKFTLAQEVEQYAPHTVFFVAAGNDGKWVDGRSRSALPNDISSLLFKKVEERFGVKVINNRIENIISVGSTGKEGHLSSFTNLVISDVFYVLSLGEKVRSYIKLTDTQGSMQEFEEKFGKLVRSTDDLTESADLEDIPFPDMKDPKLDSMDQLELQEIRISRILGELVSIVNEHLIDQHFYYSTKSSAFYDGTSMATPNAVGVAGRIITDKMLEAGLSEKQIYDHPDFTPRKVYEYLVESSVPYGEGLIRSAPLIMGFKAPKEVKKHPLGKSGTCKGLYQIVNHR